MTGREKKNHSVIDTVIVQILSQEISLLDQFSVQQFGYFSILMRLYFLKAKSRSQPGWRAGEVSKQSPERQCAGSKSFRNNTIFCLSNTFSDWHQSKKSSVICCHSVTFHVALCRGILFPPCSPYKNWCQLLASPAPLQPLWVPQGCHRGPLSQGVQAGLCQSWQLSLCPSVPAAQPEPSQCQFWCRIRENPMSAWILPCPWI